MRKEKAAQSRATVPISVYLNGNMHESLKLLSSTRKAASKKSSKPSFIVHILDDAIHKLAALINAGVEVGFVPVPASKSVRTSLRVNADSHSTALKASKNANVKPADFIRTAITFYLRSNAGEIYDEAKTPGARKRKSSRKMQ